MNSPFKYSDDNKRYQTYNYYLRHRFGKKVFKVSLNADLGCPNRDGTKGTGGCIFCSAKMSGDFAGNPEEDILEQYTEIREKMSKKWDDALCIPYFQAGSNTYGDVETLRKMYTAALSLDNAVGLSIATRADCITEEIADLLQEFSRKTYLTVELGLQTIFDKTALLCNRCHTYADFLQGFEMLKKRGINICVHIINGLPGESEDMMLETAKTVGELGIHSIKIHLLHILKGTQLEKMYEQGQVKAMERDRYVNVVCNQLEVLPEDVIIQRVTGDGAKDDLIAPLWSLKKFCVMNEIDKELVRRNSWQGKKIDKKYTPVI
ncbi:MAG: TIGR01212 family radical SAM protein [Oscillospiraceae bacterium]